MDKESLYGLFLYPSTYTTSLFLVFVLIITLLATFFGLAVTHLHYPRYAWYRLGLFGAVFLGFISFLLWHIHITPIQPPNNIMKTPTISSAQAIHLLSTYEIYLKNIIKFTLVIVAGYYFLFALITILFTKSINNLKEYCETEIEELKSQIESKDLEIHDLKNQLVKNTEIIDDNNKEIEGLKLRLSDTKHAQDKLASIKKHAYQTDYENKDLKDLLSQKFQKLYHGLIFGHHHNQVSMLLESYNKLVMHMTFFGNKDKNQHPNPFSQLKLINYHDIISELHLTKSEINAQALYKQICWLLLVLNYSDNRNVQKIKTYIDQLDYSETQEKAWSDLQNSNPKIILFTKGEIAYVL